MGQISSGIGLISGINTAQLIDQLLAIEARPKKLIEQRKAVLTTQQVAFQDINSKLLALKLAANSFTDQKVFQSTSASSSDETVLTATGSNSAVPGTYDLVVDRLVTSQQIITNGFVDRNTTPIAPSGGTLTFEFGDARLDKDAALSQLNGGAGVTRGKIRVTDRSGASAVVDLSKALSINDVLGAINDASGIAVTASIDGDKIKLVDSSGSTTTSLAVTDVTTAGAAASLGLNTAAVGNTLTGSQINRLTENTLLSSLNDGNGVRIKTADDDFDITRRDGTSFSVDLEGSVTLKDVIDKINTASGGDVTASINSQGAGLQLVDATTGATTFQVAAHGGSKAAADLGILASDGDADGTIVGNRVLASIGSRLVKNLNGGDGATLGQISITNRSGAATTINLSSSQTVQDIVNQINNAGAGVTASLNSAGNGLLLTDTTGSTTSNLIVADVSGTAAADLKLAGSVAKTTIDSGNLQLQYISEATRLSSLNGGLGVASGKFRITDSTGRSAVVDLSQGESTIQDVLSEINSRGLSINARVNDNGDGILIEDTATSPSLKIKIVEQGSTTARDLGILGEAEEAGDDLDGSFETTISIGSVEKLQTTTNLSALNGGEGVNNLSGQNDFKITTRNGAVHNINLDTVTTIQDLMNTVNTATSGAVTVSINTLGTALQLKDNTAGASTFKVESLNDSDAAQDLGILSSDDNSDGVISGTTVVEVTTLDDLVGKINEAGIPVTATIINDGSGGSPFRLSLSAERSGRSGAFLFDDGGLGFGATTLSQARDAAIFFGSSDPAKAIAITSPTNTLNSVIPGVTIDLKNVSTSPVRVTVTKSNTAIASAVQSFVDKFNEVTASIENYDSYDIETEKRGLLLGDPTVGQIRSSLYRLVSSRNTDLTGQFNTLSQIGITVSGGAKLQFDQTKFQNALETDPEAVRQLFTLKETTTDPTTKEVKITASGIGVRIGQLLERLTDPRDGLLQGRLNSIDNQIALGDKRIEQLNEQLDNKRSRLEAQFLSMERALAQLQNQGNALSSFQPLNSQSFNLVSRQS